MAWPGVINRAFQSFLAGDKSEGSFSMGVPAFWYLPFEIRYWSLEVLPIVIGRRLVEIFILMTIDMSYVAYVFSELIAKKMNRYAWRWKYFWQRV